MRIREAEESEGRLIAEEFRFPLARQMEQYSELDELAGDALTSAAEGFEDLLKEERRFVFLLEEDGAGVGFVAGEVGVRPTRKRRTYASIADLYVKEGFRGRGFGTRLIETVEELAAEADCDFVRVSAEWGNEAARNLYEKFDYDRKQVQYSKTMD